MARTDALSAKQAAFLAALLSARDTRAAAKQAGISDRTAWRWLADETFKKLLAEAKQEAFNEALSSLQTGVKTAIDTLKTMMQEAENESVRLRAAAIWLEMALQIHTKHELEARFDELEALMRAKGR